MSRAWDFPCLGRVNSAPCAADRGWDAHVASSSPLWKLCLALQGALLSQTCKSNDKVHPSVTVGSWQQKGQVAKLRPVRCCSEPGVLLPDLSCPPIRAGPLQCHIVDL